MSKAVNYSLQALCVLLSIVLSSPAVLAAEGGAAAAGHSNIYERQVIEVIKAIRDNRIDQAQQQLTGLLDQEPNFKLARLLQADLFSARAGVISQLGSVAEAGQQGQYAALRTEAAKRWRYYLDVKDTLAGQVPSNLLEVDPGQRYVLAVDMNASRMFLFENRAGDGLYLVNDFYVTIGLRGPRKSTRGDQRTPVGIYFVNDFIPAKALPDMYGAGAFPLNYPNEWDRRHGKTGYGIWLHGTPSYTFNRAPWASDGCVTLSNLDFMTLSSYIDVGRTPVILAEHIDWTTPSQLSQARDQLHQALQRWKQDWESRDVKRYLQHYSKAFFGQGKNYQAWRDNARASYANAEELNINLSDISIYAYPDEKMVVTTFNQEYRSSTAVQRSTKRQYWRFENGEWKIIYEGSV
ncbi:MAG: L,D-transpeptidase family protein [Gammaproteobacteria bacterium]|nr:L,D-transpeptidase family protein [Gammaproteobacteria bacterium]